MTETEEIFCHIPSTPSQHHRLRNGHQSVILSGGTSPFICQTCSSLICDQGAMMILWVTRYQCQMEPDAQQFLEQLGGIT